MPRKSRSEAATLQALARWDFLPSRMVLVVSKVPLGSLCRPPALAWEERETLKVRKRRREKRQRVGRDLAGCWRVCVCV